LANASKRNEVCGASSPSITTGSRDDFIVDVEPSIRRIADSDIVSQNHHDQAAALGDDERSVVLTRTPARRWAT